MSRGLRGGPGGAKHPLTPCPAPAGIVSLLLLVYLLFTSLWLIPVLYLAWIILDWDTPEKGVVVAVSPLPQALQQDGGGVRPSPECGEPHIPPAPSLHSPVISTTVGRGMQRVRGKRFPWILLPAGMGWAGRHLPGPLLALQVAGGCRACGDGPCGSTFGIISR